MIRLDGKTAIVTGATRSIGEYIARGLHGAGASVMVTGIEDAAGAALAASLGARAAYRHTDVTSDAEIEACLAETKARFGKLDILVNCACSYLDSGLATPRADWLACLNVNIVGPAIFVQRAAPYLTKPGGVVVNIGSVSGKFGNGTRGPYSAGKAALMHFTRCAAVALAPQGIRVVTVSPGWTWSPPMAEMTAGDRDLADRAGAHVHPLGRVGRMEEVANIVAFACSEEASWLNGCDLPADGGFSALGPDRGKGPRYWIAKSPTGSDRSRKGVSRRRHAAQACCGRTGEDDRLLRTPARRHFSFASAARHITLRPRIPVFPGRSRRWRCPPRFRSRSRTNTRSSGAAFI